MPEKLDLEGENICCMALQLVFDKSLWGDEGQPEIMKKGVIAVLQDSIVKMESFDYNEMTTANTTFSWWQGGVKHPTTQEMISYRWIWVEWPPS